MPLSKLSQLTSTGPNHLYIMDYGEDPLAISTFLVDSQKETQEDKLGNIDFLLQYIRKKCQKLYQSKGQVGRWDG